jgi:hypothetical protein
VPPHPQPLDDDYDPHGSRGLCARLAAPCRCT